MSEADFRSANLSFANLRGASAIGTNFSFANLRNATLSRIVLDYANLNSANLEGVDLSNASINHANLSKVRISSTVCYYDCRTASLRGTRLYNTNLSGAIIGIVDLYNTKFQKANLSGTTFEEGDDLSGSDLSEAILLATDLGRTKGLTQQQLGGASSPLLCNVTLPDGIQINSDRDCYRIPQVLHDRYPDQFKTLKDAQDYVNEARQKKWD